MLSLAQQFADARADLPTNLGTAGLRKLGNDVLRQSLFSACMSNGDAVQGLRSAVTQALKDSNISYARLALKQLGAQLGYDPAKGFPGTPPGAVPPAEEGSMLDLFSTDRLNFILQTQQEMARGAAKNIWGNDPAALDQFPAWELVRVAAVELPRGNRPGPKHTIIPVPTDAWDGDEGRWQAALDESGDDEAQAIFDATGRMIARKDSDVWAALGNGAGGHDDALGNDYEPFAYSSGMGRVQVPREEFIALGGSVDDLQPGETDFGSGQVKLSKDRFDPDILASLISRLDSGDLKFHVKVTTE